LFPLLVFGGGAINFDGVDDYIEIPSISATDWTVSVWLNEKGSDSTVASVVGFGEDGGIAYEKLFVVNSQRVYLRYKNTAPLREFLDICTPSNNFNQWYFYTITKSGNTLTVYQDTTEIGTRTDTDIGSFYPLSYPNRHIGVVEYHDGLHHYRFFNGSIDDVLIYNKALSIEEIKEIYVSKNAWYPKAGLVSRWSMENNGVSTGQPHANGSTIKDSVGSNNGTIVDGSDNSMTLESSPTRKKRGRR